MKNPINETKPDQIVHDVALALKEIESKHGVQFTSIAIGSTEIKAPTPAGIKFQKLLNHVVSVSLKLPDGSEIEIKPSQQPGAQI